MLDLKLLYKMLETPSISGYELEFQKMLNKELENIDDVTYNHHSLMVTHGIFSQGIQKLSCCYNRILSTNSFNGELKATGNLRVVNVEKFLK